MQFNFNINEVLKEPIEMIDSTSKLEYYNHHIDVKYAQNMNLGQKLSYIIDQMGYASKLAQNLPQVITTSSKLKNSDQRIYLSKGESVMDNSSSETAVVIGLLKVGYKRLFVYDNQGNQFETKPLCVLDFYVMEGRQRQGYGRNLFQYMLRRENVEPANIAIDRPSSKFLSFLAKHYNLVDPVPQANNFVVFGHFFTNYNNNDNKHSTNQHSRYSANHYHSRQRRQHNHHNSAISPMVTTINSSSGGFGGGAQHKQLPPPQPAQPICSELTGKPSNPLSATCRSRPITGNVNLDFEKAPIKSAINRPDPPMLPRGDQQLNQHKWYLYSNNPINHRTVTSNSCLVSGNGNGNNNNQSNPHHLQPDTTLPKINNNYVKSSEYNLYSSHSATKSSPSLNCDLKPQCKVIPSRTDYNYSLGLARHYSHNRIW